MRNWWLGDFQLVIMIIVSRETQHRCSCFWLIMQIKIRICSTFKLLLWFSELKRIAEMGQSKPVGLGQQETETDSGRGRGQSSVDSILNNGLINVQMRRRLHDFWHFWHTHWFGNMFYVLLMGQHRTANGQGSESRAGGKRFVASILRVLDCWLRDWLRLLTKR